MGLLDAFRPDPTCSRCGRSYSRGGSCKRCQNIAKGHAKADVKSGGAGQPRPCPRHPGHMLRGSATRCAHPDC